MKLSSSEKEFKNTDEEVENLIKMYNSRNIDYEGKLSYMSLLNIELREKNKELRILTDILINCKQNMNYIEDDNKKVPSFNENLELYKILTDNKLKNESLERSFNSKLNLLLSFLQFLNYLWLMISNHIDKNKLFNNRYSFIKTCSVNDDSQKNYINNDVYSLILNLKSSDNFDFQHIKSLFYLLARFHKNMKELESRTSINYIKSISLLHDDNKYEIIQIDNTIDRIKIYLEEAIKLSLTRMNLSKNKLKMNHNNRYINY